MLRQCDVDLSEDFENIHARFSSRSSGSSSSSIMDAVHATRISALPLRCSMLSSCMLHAPLVLRAACISVCGGGAFVVSPSCARACVHVLRPGYMACTPFGLAGCRLYVRNII